MRTAGPFTVESVSPHRTLGVDENDELIDKVADAEGHYGKEADFTATILENLKTAGVQQAHREDRITFASLFPWPGHFVCAEGRYVEGDGEDDEEGAAPEKRAAIFVGPEFGTVSRPDLVAAAREAGDARFDVLVACAFSYDAHSSEFDRLGRIPVLKARMNADLHMANDLKNTGKGNLFVIFGEPDIEILDATASPKAAASPEAAPSAEGSPSTEGAPSVKGGDDHGEYIQVRINGVDVFHPNTGEVRSDGPDGIACWFIDTDYNEESFFVRHAYFLGANDPTRRSGPPSRPRSTPMLGRPSTATSPAPSPTPLRPHRGQGHQPPRRRGHEGLPDMNTIQRLNSIAVRGYRSIEDMQLDLCPLNVLIGANGAGKSNLISFFKMMNEMMTGHLQRYVASTGHATSNLYFGPKFTSRIEADLEFRTMTGAVDTYQLRLAHAARDSLIFVEESLAFQNPGFDTPKVKQLGGGTRKP